MEGASACDGGRRGAWEVRLRAAMSLVVAVVWLQQRRARSRRNALPRFR